MKSLESSLPELFRKIFDTTSDIHIIFKSGNTGSSEGAHTTPNYSSSTFNITINTYFQDATTLSKAASILHEMIHAQLMNWYREAVLNNDFQTQQYLSNEYYFYFDSATISRSPDLSYTYMMNLSQPGQHEIMNRGKFRNAISDALYEFAHKLDPNTSVTRAYCDDMAFAGTSDSRYFKDLPQSTQDRINEIIEVERGTNTNLTQKGKPCQ